MRQHPEISTLLPRLRAARARWGRPPPPGVVPQVPRSGQESVWDYPRPPQVRPAEAPIRAYLGDTLVLASARALRIVETAGARHRPGLGRAAPLATDGNMLAVALVLLLSTALPLDYPSLLIAWLAIGTGRRPRARARNPAGRGNGILRRVPRQRPPGSDEDHPQ